MPNAKKAKNSEIRVAVHPVFLNLLDYEARKLGVSRSELFQTIVTTALVDRATLSNQIETLKAALTETEELRAQIQAIAEFIVDVSHHPFERS